MSSTSKYVRLPRAEYERLLAKAGETLCTEGPPLPRPDAQGNVPALDYLRASIAREVLRRRRAAGLSQAALAKLARVRQETISNVETAKFTVSNAVMKKLDQALTRAERSQKAQRERRRKSA